MIGQNINLPESPEFETPITWSPSFIETQMEVSISTTSNISFLVNLGVLHIRSSVNVAACCDTKLFQKLLDPRLPRLLSIPTTILVFSSNVTPKGISIPWPRKFSDCIIHTSFKPSCAALSKSKAHFTAASLYFTSVLKSSTNLISIFAFFSFFIQCCAVAILAAFLYETKTKII